MNVNHESLKEKHGDKTADVYAEIRDLGGYGNIPGDYIGGLDIQSALDPANTAISNEAKERIAKLAGVSRKEADRRVESGEVTNAETFKDATPRPPRR